MNKTTPSIHVDRMVSVPLNSLSVEERERAVGFLDAEAFDRLVRQSESVQLLREFDPRAYLVPISGRMGFVYEYDEPTHRYDVLDLVSLGFVEMLRGGRPTDPTNGLHRPASAGRDASEARAT